MLSFWAECYRVCHGNQALQGLAIERLSLIGIPDLLYKGLSNAIFEVFGCQNGDAKALGHYFKNVHHWMEKIIAYSRTTQGF